MRKMMSITLVIVCLAPSVSYFHLETYLDFEYLQSAKLNNLNVKSLL